MTDFVQDTAWENAWPWAHRMAFPFQLSPELLHGVPKSRKALNSLVLDQEFTKTAPSPAYGFLLNLSLNDKYSLLADVSSMSILKHTADVGTAEVGTADVGDH